VGQYFTPEEKLAFATFLTGKQRMQTLLPAVQSAGLLDLEAKWRYALLIANPTQRQPAALIELQQRRLQFDELGAQLEGYWKALPPETENRDSYLDQAARFFRLAANTSGELRVLALKDQQGGLNGPQSNRYAELLTRSPQKLTAAASSDPSEDVRNAIANYVIKSGDASRSFDVIAARGRGLPPVWTRAYTALAGLYFVPNTAPVNAAFHDALGSALIGDRLGKPVDRTQQLAGDVWFYYGARYGKYLGATKQSDGEDYLPAMVENRPGGADAYFHLAEYYRDSNQTSRCSKSIATPFNSTANAAMRTIVSPISCGSKASTMRRLLSSRLHWMLSRTSRTSAGCRKAFGTMCGPRSRISARIEPCRQYATLRSVCCAGGGSAAAFRSGFAQCHARIVVQQIGTGSQAAG